MTVAGGDGSGRLDPDIARAVGDFVNSAARLPMDRLLDIEDLAASAVGASGACIYIADYAQQLLSPLRGTGSADAVGIDATVRGRVFQTGRTHVGDGRVIAAMVEGRDRIGVVECTFDRGDGSVDLVEAIGRAVSPVLAGKRRYTDLVPRARRVRPLSTAAEMQWELLPPLSGQPSGASVAGMVEPAYSTGGDSFDYAVNGDLLDFIVIDAVGHGMPAVLMSTAAITTYRNVRREQGSLENIYADIGRTITEQFGHSSYVTGVIASLRTSTGELTWINAGHPEPMLVRGGSLTPPLHCTPSKPMGLGGTVREQQTITLQPADRVLIFTDGVVERRHGAAASPHLASLTDLLLRATLDELAGPETVRRLVRSVLDSCDGELADDATLVLVDYLGRPIAG